MILKLQSARFSGNRGMAAPVWARWLVLTFALLFGVVSTAQAAHVHRPTHVEHRFQGLLAGSPNADTEERCPLCVAVHAALPASMQVAGVPVPVDEVATWTVVERTGSDTWHFARFGRPPPMLVLAT